MNKCKIILLVVLNFIIVPLTFASGEKNDQDAINQKSTDGKKQGKWIYFGKDRPETGTPPTGKVEEGKYIDDRKEGFWIRYYTDGVTPKLKGEFSNNRPDGMYYKFYPNGKLREKGTYENSNYNDSLVRYHENGTVEYEAKYNEQGREQGKVKYYYPNGQCEFVYYANNGTQVGEAIRYWPNGDVKEIITFSADGTLVSSTTKEPVHPMNDAGTTIEVTEKAPVVGAKPIVLSGKWQFNGYNKIYNSENEIWQDGVFKDGRLWDGKVYVYDKDGILLKVKVFKNGVYHSDGQL
jgi:antitoxin component YwqK of YwqJK toxin-antitoxin module